MESLQSMASGPLPGFVRLLALACWLLGALPAAGHIGSPDVFYDGQAGPWPVRVMVRSPGVVPGLAKISVRVHEPGADAVRVRSVRWDLDLISAPPAEVARAVGGDSSRWSAELRFVAAGSYSVYVEVEGAAGTGTAIVPVHMVAPQKLEMHPLAQAVLLALVLLWVAAFVRLVAAGMRSVLEPGTEVDPHLVRASSVPWRWPWR